MPSAERGTPTSVRSLPRTGATAPGNSALARRRRRPTSTTRTTSTTRSSVDLPVCRRGSGTIGRQDVDIRLRTTRTFPFPTGVRMPRAPQLLIRMTKPCRAWSTRLPPQLVRLSVPRPRHLSAQPVGAAWRRSEGKVTTMQWPVAGAAPSRRPACPTRLLHYGAAQSPRRRRRRCSSGFSSSRMRQFNRAGTTISASGPSASGQGPARNQGRRRQDIEGARR
jgi:hypothetical protein